MNNFGMSFGWGQAGMGGGSQMPWGGAFNQGRRGLGGLPQVSPYQQQRPVLPPMSQPRPVSPMPQRMPPARQGIMNPPAQNRFQTPLHPPQSAAYGANQGVMGGRGPASQAGSIPDPTPYLNRELQNPGFQPGFLSVPPEPTVPSMDYSAGVRPTKPPSSPLPPFFYEQEYRAYPNGNLSPQDSAQLRSMDEQQRNMQLRDKNPNYRYMPAFNDSERQRIAEKNTMLPDVNDPNFRGITPQQAFQQIPGNPFSKMGDRFTAISANRPPVEPPMTASQPTSTMPNYGQRVQDVNPTTAENIGNPQYMADNRITPMPRADGQLSPLESATMQAAGSSIGEWKAKSDWLAQKYPDYKGTMTPEMAQAYAAEQQRKRFNRDDQEMAARQRDNQRLDVDRQWRMRRREQNFRYNNPLLFSDPNFASAQLAAVMAGGDLKQFQQQGLTPAQQEQAKLQNQQNQVQLIQQEPDEDKRAAMIEAMKQGQNIFGGGGGYQQQPGSAPTQPPSPVYYGSGVQGAQNQQAPNVPPGRPPLSPREASERNQSTSREAKFSVMRKWADAKHKPTPQEMEIAGIDSNDIMDFHDDNGYGPGNMLDWTMDLLPWPGNHSSAMRGTRYDWATGMLK